MKKPQLFIGLMSGTSMDGIDAVLVDFSQSVKLCATHSEKIPVDLKQQLLALSMPGDDEINRTGRADVLMGKQLALATNNLLKQANISADKIIAIGSHGQTIRHRPDLEFTLQIGDANIIAARTGITTVADFRRRDMAHGGQGAPLVPAFHQALFQTDKNRVIVNIGGIANLTILSNDKNAAVIGFDSGPGNTLLDYYARKNINNDYDNAGAFAALGKINQQLLNDLLSDDYFQRNPPKSTGFEYFNASWLEHYLTADIAPKDLQATLTELTAVTIINAITKYAKNTDEIYLCGGGVHNKHLLSRIQALANAKPVKSTAAINIDPDWLEAIAFAWLAKQRINQQSGNMPSVTGANHAAILGAIYAT